MKMRDKSKFYNERNLLSGSWQICTTATSVVQVDERLQMNNNQIMLGTLVFPALPGSVTLLVVIPHFSYNIIVEEPTNSY